jgi:hypothetical protein
MTQTRRSILTSGAVAALAGPRILSSIRPARMLAAAAELTATQYSTVTPLPPSGDTTGATDSANIQGQLASFGSTPVQLGAGVFYLAAPLTLSSGNSLIGSGGACQGGTPAVTGAGAKLGTVLTFGSSWSTAGLPAGSNPGVIMLAGTGTQARMNITDLWIDGSISEITVPAGVDGIAATGAQDSVSLVDVGAYRLNGNGFAAYPSSSGSVPDGWYITDCLVQQCDESGVAGSFANSTFMAVHVQTSAQHGFYLQSGNVQLIGCRSEQNLADGFRIEALCTGGSLDSVILDGCGTTGNSNYGLNVVNANPTGTNAGSQLAAPVAAAGCTFVGDGTAGGSYAGICAAGEVILTVTGSYVLVSDVNVTAGCPALAFVAATAGTSDGIPNVVSFSNSFLNCAGQTYYTVPSGEFSNQPGFVSTYGFRGGQWSGGAPSPL